MNRFDVNAYFGHWPYWDLYDKTFEDLVILMDRFGIERAAALSLRGVLVDWREGNRETLSACARYPDRLIPIATISPFMSGGPDELNRLVDSGMRGVRLYPAFHSYRLDSDFVGEICRVAAEREIPVTIPTRIMMNWRFTPVPFDSIAAVVERYQATQFILSGPNYLIEYQALVRLMKRAENCAYEIACLQGFGSVCKLVDEVGAGRVLFGTGAVLHYPACNVSKLDHADLTDEQRQMIAAENAKTLLNV